MLLMGVTHAQETYIGNLRKKFAPMHMTKIVRFDWAAVFESFWHAEKNLHGIEQRSIRRKFLVQVSGTSFLSVCHPY